MSRLGTPARVVLALFALVLVLFTKDAPGSWADGSRLGTIQALVEQHTLALDRSDYFWQGDKVYLASKDAYYSHQPPLLALCGAPLYALLHHAFGRAIDDAFTYRLLTWWLVGLPLLAGLWALARLLQDTGCGAGWCAAWLAAGAFGTLALPYALVLNQHGPAAGLSMLALFAATRRRPASAGALLALAATIDLSAIFAALAFAWPALRASGFDGLARYGLGALPILALHLGINWELTGDLVPLGLHAEAFRYPLSPFMLMALTGGGGEDPEGTQALYAWRALFGQSGLFSHHPILLVCVGAGLALPLRARSRLAPGVLPAVASSALGVALYYLTQSRNFGGSAFGMRWFTLFAPLLVLFPAAWLGGAPEPRVPRRLARVAFAALLAWSSAAACLGAVQPWMKFAYLPHQRPDALLLEEREDLGLCEHLRREWARVTTWQQSFDRPRYELWFEDILWRHARLRLREWPGMDEPARRAWVQAGIDALQPMVDLLDEARHPSSVRPRGHFWLGKLHRRLGNRERARAEYERALELDPAYPPARQALEQLEREAP